MKVAIITFHAAKNFGAALQAFATQSVLERMSHEPCFPHVRSQRQMVSKYRRKKYGAFQKFFMAVVSKKLDRRIALFDRFAADRFRLTKRYESHEALARDLPDVDAYICGSDQIWNLEKGPPGYFYLDFVPDDKRRISFAPSFGTTDIPEQYREDVGKLLKSFDHLSVRERSAMSLVESLAGKRPEVVCDPVFLLENSFWEGVAKRPSFDRPYAVFYSLQSTPDLSACVAHLAGKYKLPIVVLAKGGSFVFWRRSILAIDSGPEEFLGWIRHAKLVITNSFHATAFSIKFDVPFVTIAHKTRNARMACLLADMHLSERLVRDYRDLRQSETDWLRKPNHDASREALESIVSSSKQFLQKALES
jgi:hypothetical protein